MSRARRLWGRLWADHWNDITALVAIVVLLALGALWKLSL